MEPNEGHVLLLIPLGLAALYILDSEENTQPAEAKETPKEEYFLRYNNDEIFKGILAIEGHFRNVKGKPLQKGELGCIVKHSGEVEGHADEGISHSLIAENPDKSHYYRDLRDDIRELRWRVQIGTISPDEGIQEIRRIRHGFEKVNPEYNIDKCKACSIEVTVKPE